MNNEMITTTARSSAVIAAEIKTIVRQTQMIVLQNAMEIGKRLMEAKELVPHGEWLDYVERECDFSQSTANNMMQLYKEYGNDQQSLFGGNSQAFVNLPYTKALRLLAVPAEEREEFAAKVDAENISTRELDKAIKERDEAIKAEQAARELGALAQQQYETARDQVEQLTREAEEAKGEVAKSASEMTKIRAELREAQKAEQEAKREAADAKAAGQQIPDSLMEQLRRDAEADAAAKARREMEAKLQQAEAKAAKAAKQAEEAERKLEEARKANTTGDPETAVFAAQFTQMQETFNKCVGLILKVQATDPDKAAKLIKAGNTLLDKMRESLNHQGEG